jgi:prolyl-tRNA editing enzyme YbaK/EbsC (Cys-tRNA(Pro) deacylase)
MQAVQTTRRLVVEDAVADRRTVLGFLFAHQVPCELRLRTSARHQPSDDGGKADFAELPKPIQDALEAALASGIDGRVIYHPNIDGTHSEHAAFALGVDVTHVLKCMILKSDDGRFVAALCEGGQTRLDLEKIAGIVGCDRLEFATLPEVHRVTGYPAGGVPLVSLFAMETLDRKLISRGVLRLGKVVGSAGSEFIGIEVEARRLVELGGEVCDVTG